MIFKKSVPYSMAFLLCFLITILLVVASERLRPKNIMDVEELSCFFEPTWQAGVILSVLDACIVAYLFFKLYFDIDQPRGMDWMKDKKKEGIGGRLNGD